jgi:nucleoside-diphosphate-sugar epimerase
MAEAVTRPKVLLLGARSQIGVFAIPRLLAAGYRVQAVSRDPRPGAFPAFEGLDWVSLRELAARPAAFSALVSAGPIELARDAVRRIDELQRAVVFSTSSVFTKQESTDPRERSQIRGILDAEDELRRMCAERGISLCLLRPTLVYGCGLDRNVTRLANWLRRWRFLPVAGRAAGLRQPVHADDLAMAAVAALAALRPSKGEQLDFILCGGSTVSYREMARRIGEGIGFKARLIPVPPAMLTGVAAWLERLPGETRIRAAMVRRQNADLVFDDHAARERLGFAPRPFGPSAADFRMPSEPELRALARPPAARRGGSH